MRSPNFSEHNLGSNLKAAVAWRAASRCSSQAACSPAAVFETCLAFTVPFRRGDDGKEVPKESLVALLVNDCLK